jgi:glycosyltransferase involved in cell wall biosynthesis
VVFLPVENAKPMRRRSVPRIDWIGSPSIGGVGGMCRLFLRELSRRDIELHVYASEGSETLPGLQGQFDGDLKRFISFPYSWDWNAWYARNKKVAFVSGFLKRLPTHNRIVDALVREHRRSPYDVVFQFSQGELFRLGKYRRDIPVVLYPCVHAAGERFWCRREAHLSSQCEALWWRIVRDGYLFHRSVLQRRDYNRAKGVIGMSRRFNELVERDYNVLPNKMGVVYHPIEILEGFENQPIPIDQPELVRLLFVGRISVRKGIDVLLAAIPDILASDPKVEIVLVGGGALWSNYEALLEKLPRERCTWLGSLTNDRVQHEMESSHILLVPSQYEPGGIVVGEALANGMKIVASDAVGSAENLPTEVCRQFAAGDVRSFLEAIRLSIVDVRRDPRESRRLAMLTARQKFDPSKMTDLLLSETKRIMSATFPPGLA